MSRYYLYAIIFALVSITTRVSAQSLPMNAGLVGSIWYDSSPVVFDTTIKINTAFYNESDTEITGVAVFKDGEVLLGSDAFVAAPRSVTPLSVAWKTTEGTHAVSVNIEGSDVQMSVIQTTTTLEIKKPVVVVPVTPSKPLTLETVKDTAINTIVGLTQKVDSYTDALAESIQSQKNPPPLTDQKREGQVLGIESEEQISLTATDAPSIIITAKNTGIDSITWIVRNWQWGALALLVLILWVLRKIRRNH
ncbi:hypothetical protein K2Q02_02595 [Patescibacteria group bacterium]|nr:hypothetical protein [Patescibacteria group bacterium]